MMPPTAARLESFDAMSIGDVVSLKSGGPLMTVIAVSDPPGPDNATVDVQYWDKGKLKSATYPIPALDSWTRS